MIWKGPDNDNNIYWATLDAFTDKWEFHGAISGNATDKAPSVAGFTHDEMRVVYKGIDHNIYWLEYNADGKKTWSTPVRVADWQTDNDPYLTYSGDDMYLLWRDKSDGMLSLGGYDVNDCTWKLIERVDVGSPIHTKAGPVACPLGGDKLLMVWINPNNDQLNSVVYSFANGKYTDIESVQYAGSQCLTQITPAIHLISPNQAMLSWKALDNDQHIFYTYFSWDPEANNGSWSRQYKIQTPDVRTPFSPALATFMDRIYLFAGDNSKENHVWHSFALVKEELSINPEVVPEQLSWSSPVPDVHSTKGKVGVWNSNEFVETVRKGEDDDQAIYWDTINLQTGIKDYHGDIPGNATDKAPSIVGYGSDGLVIVYKGMNNKLYQLDYNAGGKDKWSNPTQIKKWQTLDEPCLTYADGDIYMAWRNKKVGALCLGHLDLNEGTWKRLKRIKNAGNPVLTHAGPVLCPLSDDRLLVVWIDQESTYLNFTVYSLSDSTHTEVQRIEQSGSMSLASITPDVLQISKNQAILSWTGFAGNDHIFYSYFSWSEHTNSGTWSKIFNTVHNHLQTEDSPALLSYLDRVYVFFPDKLNYDAVTYSFAELKPVEHKDHKPPHSGGLQPLDIQLQWSPVQASMANKTDGLVALQNIGREIHMVWKELYPSHKIFHAILDTADDTWKVFETPYLSNGAPTLITLADDTMLIIFREPDYSLLKSAIIRDGDNYSEATRINPLWYSIDSELYATQDADSAYLFWRTNPQYQLLRRVIHMARYDLNSNKWDSAERIPPLHEDANFIPSAAILNAQELLCVRRRYQGSFDDKSPLWYTANDTANKSWPTELPVRYWSDKKHSEPQQYSYTQTELLALNAELAILFLNKEDAIYYTIYDSTGIVGSSEDLNKAGELLHWTTPVKVEPTTGTAKSAPSAVMCGQRLFLFWLRDDGQIMYAQADLS